MRSLPTPTTPLDSVLSLHDFEISAKETLKPKVRNFLRIPSLCKADRKFDSFQSWAYYESSADDGQTYKRSKEIWQEIKFRPRVMRDVSGDVDLRTSFFGFESSMPIMISPAAMGSEFNSLWLSRSYKGARADRVEI